MESTWKIGKIGPSWKFLLFGQHLCKSQLLETGHLHNFWALNEEMGSKIGMYSKNWVGQVRFEILTLWSRSKVHQVKAFSLSFFFFFGRRFGPGPVSRSVKSVSGGDVISDVIEQRACMRVAREINSCTCERVRGSSRACHCRHSAPDLLKARGSAWLIVRACNFWVLQIGARWISWYCSFSEI